MFACLPVYLFIRLFIIWKWLYKLSMNMLRQIQIILFDISWFPLDFVFFFKQEKSTEKKNAIKHSLMGEWHRHWLCPPLPLWCR